MSLSGGDYEPRRASDDAAGLHEERRQTRPWHLATGSLACPQCDAPVSLGPGSVAPADAFGCPFCDHLGRVRDFLSLAQPPRAPRVSVLVRHPG